MAKEKEDKDAKGKGGKGHDAAHDKGAKHAAAKPAEAPAKPAKQEKGKAEKAAKPAQKEAAPTQPPRLKVHYQQNVVPALMKQFGYKTVMQVPRVAKITLNMGVGEAVADKKVLEHAASDMQKIAGQKPVITKSKKSVAAFKIRDGYPVGVMVTLRNRRMYEFLDRLVTIALPRVRDFRGISPRSFDRRGSYNMGVKEQIIFPEIEYDKIDTLRGLNISITTTAKTDEEAKALLAAFRFPFRTERV
jgi:large subunit ribosomal protein L5